MEEKVIPWDDQYISKTDAIKAAVISIVPFATADNIREIQKTFEKTIDGLQAAHVVPLPVEVGMPVYEVKAYYDPYKERRVNLFNSVMECRVTMLTQKRDKTWKIRVTNKNGDSVEYLISDFGKTIFLDRDEAESAFRAVEEQK